MSIIWYMLLSNVNTGHVRSHDDYYDDDDDMESMYTYIVHVNIKNMG